MTLMAGAQSIQKWAVTVVVTVVVLFCVLVLGLTATSPDIGVRCLLRNPDPTPELYPGVEICSVPHLVAAEGCLRPEPRDFLIRVGERSTCTFSDFSVALSELRDALILPGGQLDRGADVSELAGLIPAYVMVGDRRLVEIEFWRAGWASARTSYIQVHSLPFGEIILTYVWFLLAFGVFVLSALAVWHRPFDRPARLFFAMCAVTLGAYVGGFHWWVIASRLWLTIPFILCATLLPVVSLHFFLVYPHAIPLVDRRPRQVLAALYTVPILAIAVMISVLVYIRWLQVSDSGLQTASILGGLGLLRHVIYVYLVFAGLCFFCLLGVLAHGFLTTRLPLERHQMKWIFSVGLVVAIPISYTLYLAFSSAPDARVRFAFGWESRLSMFIASLCFMLAYAVGIIRLNLILVDQIVSKGMVYYLVSYGATFVFGVSVAGTIVLANSRNLLLSAQQSVLLALILTLVVLILLWLRDRFQQVIDRRFYREKYQLDKAFQKINQAIGHFADRQSLAQRMMASCREVLRVECMALYVCDAGHTRFHLLAAEGIDEIPMQFSADTSLLNTMKRDSTLQRVRSGIRSSSSEQALLLRLRAELLHTLAVRGEIAGIVVLGAKSNGSSYSAEDLTFLNALGQITSIALHSEGIHRDITRLNEELQLKAEKINEQKRRIAMMQAELTSSAPALPPASPQDFSREAIKGNSPAIRRVLDMARKVALSDASVLIHGESGTGKEVLAQVIHDNSPRKSGTLVRVHCAALSPSLLESELFGHMKGAFTGAHRDRIGRFELANGGTLFLDEIGDISLETQIKLLRVLQTRAFEPVGGSRTIHVDVRLITATHQNLRNLIATGRFREDLYYRLNVVALELPPLRDRKEDLFELAIHFLQRASRRIGKPISHIDDDALKALQQYDWPGNIRELENTVERAVVMAETDRVTKDDLALDLVAVTRPRAIQVEEAMPVLSSSARVQRKPRLAAARTGPDDLSEHEMLLDALHQCGGNKAQAARLLDMPRSTYYSKLKKLEMESQ